MPQSLGKIDPPMDVFAVANNLERIAAGEFILS
jgi:hypothetical protein